MKLQFEPLNMPPAFVPAFPTNAFLDFCMFLIDTLYVSFKEAQHSVPLTSAFNTFKQTESYRLCNMLLGESAAMKKEGFFILWEW